MRSWAGLQHSILAIYNGESRTCWHLLTLCLVLIICKNHWNRFGLQQECRSHTSTDYNGIQSQETEKKVITNYNRIFANKKWEVCNLLEKYCGRNLNSIWTHDLLVGRTVIDKKGYFLLSRKFELIKPVLPQAAKVGIFFINFLHHFIEMHLQLSEIT